jgi:hypothetical protein
VGRVLPTGTMLLSARPSKDELEGLMAAQLVVADNAAMECCRRAMIGEQTESYRESAQVNKLSRTFATLLEALNRRRGKGEQKVTVEHVRVHSGGQAVVGPAESAGGGDRTKLEDQPIRGKLVVHISRRCGARTGQESPCRQTAMPDGRCRMHGGRSLGARTVTGTPSVGLRNPFRWVIIATVDRILDPVRL